MDKSISSALKKVMDSTKELVKCQENFCKKERLGAEKESKILQSKIVLLKDKKLTLETLASKLNKIKNTFIESEKVRELGLCSLKKCEKNVTSTFKELVNLYKLDTTPNGVKKYNEAKKIMEQPLDIDRYIQFVRVTTRLN